MNWTDGCSSVRISCVPEAVIIYEDVHSLYVRSAADERIFSRSIRLQSSEGFYPSVELNLCVFPLLSIVCKVLEIAVFVIKLDTMMQPSGGKLGGSGAAIYMCFLLWLCARLTCH